MTNKGLKQINKQTPYQPKLKSIFRRVLIVFSLSVCLYIYLSSSECPTNFILLCGATTRMSRIHPSRNCGIDATGIAGEGGRTTVWTVWKKSSMAFQGSDGFSVYDGEGKLAFRVDNYSRRRKCVAGEIVLMDGAGKPLLFLRPQILSMHDQWNGFKGEDGSNNRSRTQIFSMRRCSIKAEILLNSPTGQSMTPDFRLEGCFWRRCCIVKDKIGEEVAKICRKTASSSVLLSNDVFSLFVKPGIDCKLVMAFVVIMDRICQKPYTPLMCS